MASEMIELVARALAVCDGLDPDAACLVGLKTMRCWEARIPNAISAIETMRNPTKEMIHAACAEARKEQIRPIEIHRVDADLIWRAMIGAALGEK